MSQTRRSLIFGTAGIAAGALAMGANYRWGAKPKPDTQSRVSLHQDEGQPSATVSLDRDGHTQSWECSFVEAFVLKAGVYHEPRSAKPKPHYAGTGQWSTKSGVAIHKRVIDNPKMPVSYDLLVNPGTDHLDLLLVVQNNSDVEWDDRATIISCFQQITVNDLFDKDGSRSLVVNNGKITPVSKLVKPMEMPPPYDGQFGLYYREPLTPPNQRVTETLIMRESTSGYATGFAWDKAWMVSGNLKMKNCIHSNPSMAGLQRGRTRADYGRIYLHAPSPAHLLERFRHDFSTNEVRSHIERFRSLNLSELLNDAS